MQIDSYDAIIAFIEKNLEGNGFYLNITLACGRAFNEYTIYARKGGIVELSKDDHPPVWIEIAEIAAIELCS